MSLQSVVNPVNISKQAGRQTDRHLADLAPAVIIEMAINVELQIPYYSLFCISMVMSKLCKMFGVLVGRCPSTEVINKYLIS